MAREKSVLYPSATWEECVEFIKKIDRYNGKVTYDTVAQDYGLKTATTKSFAYKLSTSKQFGLVKTTGGSVVELTDLAKNYLYPVNENTESMIKLQCFQMPPLYVKLIERFNGRALPSETQLANILLQSYEIVKSAKDNAARCFIINAEQMGVKINGVLNCSIPNRGEEISDLVDEGDKGVVINEPVDKPVQPLVAEQVPKVKQEKEYVQQNYETESGKVAQIIIPKDATQDDLAAISDMLNILIKRRFKFEIE